MPVIWFKPTDEPLTPPPPAAANGSAAVVRYYECPIYSTTCRGGAITYVRLPSDVGEAHWVKRSTALICSLDE